MKYIILESKLDEMRVNYLDSRVGKYYTLDEYIVISYAVNNEYVDDYDETLMEYTYEDESLYINHEFVKGFSDLFFQNNSEAYQFIIKWFEDSFGENVESVNS